MLVASPQAANSVKEAAPLLSTHICLKKLSGLLDRKAGGNMQFAV